MSDNAYHRNTMITPSHESKLTFLIIAGSEISSEPMYILLNTAVSKQWGFPKTCPGGCPCEKYDCRSPRWQDTCGFSEGFCDMIKNDGAPPQYTINWVRVYQDPTNERQKVGCSTPERPTRKFIEAHEKQYKTADDVSPGCLPTVLFVCNAMLTFVFAAPGSSSQRNSNRTRSVQYASNRRIRRCLRRPQTRSMQSR